MIGSGWQAYAQIALLVALLLVLAKPLGDYMARVFDGGDLWLEKPLGWLERLVYRVAGVPSSPEAREMPWKTYAVAMLLLNVGGVFVVYAVARLQALLPLNPDGMSAVAPDLSWNTAVSFVTNTNWQSYGGETTMSYFTQMAALAVQNFVCAASGIAAVVALIRGMARKSSPTIGNFWVDLTRSTLYVLLPLSVVLALVLVSQGVVQTFAGAQHVSLLQTAGGGSGSGVIEQVIARSAPSPRRRPSSSSAPTAAASSTRTPRTPSRTRRRSPTSSACTRCS